MSIAADDKVTHDRDVEKRTESKIEHESATKVEPQSNAPVKSWTDTADTIWKFVPWTAGAFLLLVLTSDRESEHLANAIHAISVHILSSVPGRG